MVRNAVLVLALGAGVLGPSVVLARTPTEEAACRRDAVHFCRGLSEEFQVRDCLVSQKQRISRTCRAVLESHGL
jgi:hypothetical protein